NRLSKGDQVAVPGETGRALKRNPEYDERLPQILERLKALGSVGALAKEMEMTYTRCAGLLKARGVDIRPYQTGRHPSEPPAAIAPATAKPLDTQKEPTVQTPGTGLPRTLTVLLDMLPDLPPEKRGLWKMAFVAAFDLEYGRTSI
ncbi:MAG: hypothetical protein PHE59_04830, partial [Patescibacteria group bacterium]|nr:hypothetical protein [Patescibacteria group bacterium]